MLHLLHFHVSRAGEDVSVIQESAATEEALIAGKLAHHLRRARRVAVVHVVNRAHIVHTSASYEHDVVIYTYVFICIYLDNVANRFNRYIFSTKLTNTTMN